MTVIIVGAGIAGLSAGYHLKQINIKPILLEKESEYGGLCRSKVIGDAIFDYGVHVSFTQDDYVKKIFEQSVSKEFVEHTAVPCNYWHGFWIPHQPQNHLSYLPKPTIKKILIDFIKAKYDEKKEINNYRDWCHNQFGNFFAENFTDIYTKKFWTIDPENLTTEWIGNRLNQPDLDTILDGALDIPRKNQHYVSIYRYPKKGGYHSFLILLAQGLNIKYNTYPTLIDPSIKEIQLNTGNIIRYDHIISTIPLPELVKSIKNVPETVIAAKNNLKWTSLCMLNFSVDQKLNSDAHWNYYYDENIPFSRLFYMSKFSEYNAPNNCETIQVEIPYSNEKPINKELSEIITEVTHWLSKTEKIDPEKIHFLGHFDIPYGYVIYNHERMAALKVIFKFLNKMNILSCGRFGEWAYLWSDQAFLSGKKAANKVIS